ncbi:hypothetical protein M9H77_20657 [Catharanthus roseus]|uniref:Uncharacterized protein n=1 Tax=Catharanthus roseus TaxID=4058 RepID=A0ACC0AME3_CATRO|nr:hypothetical protein M9H77_20657 [Catharanthus roseus]
MMQVIDRHGIYSKNYDKQDNPPLLPQCENHNHALLKKELMGKTLELRQLKGEELQGLGMEELIKLEKMIEAGLNRVTKSKGEKYIKEITNLKKKEAQLREENARLKQKNGNGNTCGDDQLETRVISLPPPEQQDQYSSASVNYHFNIPQILVIQPPPADSDTLLKLSLA